MHDHTPPPPSDELAQEWDGRYTAEDGHLWTGLVNDVVLAEVPGLTPGRALDVGCGEGADAIWLAREGWDVTGLDVSEVALDRARDAAAAAGVDVTWLLADLADDPTAGTTFDLVSAQYPVLQQSAGDDVLRALLGAAVPVAPFWSCSTRTWTRSTPAPMASTRPTSTGRSTSWPGSHPTTGSSSGTRPAPGCATQAPTSPT